MEVNMLRFARSSILSFVSGVALLLTQAAFVAAAPNLLCPGEDVAFNPGNGEDIVVPPGFKVEVFAKGLNFPTGIAFRGEKNNFQVYVLESGHGLPSGSGAHSCNDEAAWQTKGLPGRNPFTPDVLVFNQGGTLIRTLGKPTDATTDTGGTGVFQPHGPAVDIAFEQGLEGGRLFATDSNQATHAHNGQNNSSRIVTVDLCSANIRSGRLGRERIFVMQAAQYRFREHERTPHQSMSGFGFRDSHSAPRRIRYARSQHTMRSTAVVMLYP